MEYASCTVRKLHSEMSSVIIKIIEEKKSAGTRINTPV